MERRLLRREPLVLAFGAAFRLLLLVVMGLASSGADRDLGGLSLIETYVPVLDTGGCSARRMPVRADRCAHHPKGRRCAGAR